METIAERLKRLRLEAGLSQRELQAPGVSYAYISRIEAGTRNPSVKALRKLAGRLAVSADYLETGEERIEISVRAESVDAYAAEWHAELTWAELTADERRQVTQGLEETLAKNLASLVFAVKLNRRLEEEASCGTTTAATT